MRAGVKKYNAKRLEEQQVEETEEQRIIGSTDFKAFYQNMPVAGAAGVVRRMAETTELDVKTDNIELALFLASTLKKEEVERLGLKEVVHTRLHNHELLLELQAEKFSAEDQPALQSGDHQAGHQLRRKGERCWG